LEPLSSTNVSDDDSEGVPDEGDDDEKCDVEDVLCDGDDDECDGDVV
jgi:hypothetical protein